VAGTGVPVAMRIRVNGIPAPQGSKRPVGNGRMVESSKAVKPWREAVRAETQRVMTETGARAFDDAVVVSVLFWLPRPKTVRRKYPTTRPDGDKLLRAVLDGITDGGALRDDSIVVDHHSGKRYADGRAPGCLIRIEEI
jgi:crossover junction endodeoxyribonuclease RusA